MSRLTRDIRYFSFIWVIALPFFLWLSTATASEESKTLLQNTHIIHSIKDLAATQLIQQLPLQKSVTQVHQRQPVTPRLLILSDLIGYIEPCGCTIDLTLGGIDRVAAVIKAERAKGPVALLVVGSHLFDGHTPDFRVPQDKAKATLLREILHTLKPDAFISGVHDYSLDQSFIQSLTQKYPLSDVTVNLTSTRQSVGARMITLGHIKIGIFGLIPKDLPHPHGMSTDVELAAVNAVQQLHDQGADVIVGLSALSRNKLRTLAQRTSLSNVDIWVHGYSPNEEQNLSPVEETNSYIVEAGDRGRNIGVIELHDAQLTGPLKDPHGDRTRAIKMIDLKIKMKRQLSSNGFGAFGNSINKKQEILKLESEKATLQLPFNATGKHLVYTLKAIDPSLPTDPLITTQVSRYQSELKSLNLKAAGKVIPLKEGQAGYAKNTECALCHPDAQKFWKTTRHSHAWSTLVEADKIYDVECVGCHVTGWQSPGGSALSHTDGFENVQCEACHGPSSIHAEVGGGEAGTQRLVPANVCQNCHNQHHSPRFNYQEYRKKILGPGHGLPAKTPHMNNDSSE